MYPIPANATRIRYLESTGTQYIDTGVYGTSATVATIDIMPTAKPVAFGSRTSASGYNASFAYFFSNTAAYNYGSGYVNVSASAITLNARNVITADAVNKTISVNGVVKATSTSTLDQTQSTILLLARDNVTEGTVTGQTSGRLYSASITESGTLVRSFIPVRVGQVGYLFDRVSGQLFGNAGTGDFVLGPDTFSQGVVPTRMMAMGVRKKAIPPPTVFNYFCFKVVASRFTRRCTSLAYMRSRAAMMIQLSELKFINSSGTRYAYPSDMTISNYTMFDGERHYSAPTTWTNYNSGEAVGRIFDNSTSTKWAAYNTNGFSSAYANVYDYDTGTALMVSGGSYDATFVNDHFGAFNKHPPVALVLNVSSSPLDISVYSRWQFLNANDNASYTDRTLVEGEILGSVDGATWWRLDIFNDTDIPDTNKAVAYTGNLVARPGNLWSDLDLATRDWANGITVDNI